ncbi:MAG: DNRLRE domain-containing protein [Chloroflexota bacterium]
MLAALAGLRPVGAAADASIAGADSTSGTGMFTIITLPDTQYYSQKYPFVFLSQTQWIVEKRDELNIVYVTHEGDIVQTASDSAQWANADAALSLLEDPLTTGLADGIPYSVVPGNHDEGPLYNTTFGVSRFAGRGYYGGEYPTGDNQNNYTLFSGGGMDFIAISLDYLSPAEGVLDWADNLLSTYSNRRAIVTSHYILNYDGSYGEWGQEIYNALKDNPNLFLLLCGHVGGEEMRRIDVNGDIISHALLADYQIRQIGGGGWLRVMEFSPADNAIHVKTYSPYLNQWEVDANSDFMLPYDMGGADTVPEVRSITRAGPDPALTETVDFTITFNMNVTGLDKGDIYLVKTGDIEGAKITTIAGSGKTYTVTASTGTGSGTLQLALYDDDTIKNALGIPLNGTGIMNGSFFHGETYTITKGVPQKKVLRSTGAYDGWVRESAETSNKGGSLNATNTTFVLGDDAANKQYRSILSFNTSSLPDNAVITRITFKVKKQGILGGGNPVTASQGFMVDVKKGVFGASALQLTDFQALAGKSYGPFKPTPVNGWYSFNLTNAKAYVNKLASNGGLTQIRLRFKLDDNNNGVANFLSLYSGNAPLTSRPLLIVEYYVP